MDEHLRRVDVWEPFPSPVPPLKETMAKGAVKHVPATISMDLPLPPLPLAAPGHE